MRRGGEGEAATGSSVEIPSTHFLTAWLQQVQLAGTGDRFGAPLDLEFAEDLPVVPFHRVQGEEELRANLSIREPLGNEVQDFHLALT